MKILITGGRGFIGWNLTQYLRGRKHEVHTLDNCKVPEYANLKTMTSHDHEGDIRIRDYLEGFFKDHQFEAIIHMAAKPGVRVWLEDIAEQIDVNGAGFANVLLAVSRQLPKLKKFIYATSSSGYVGRRDHTQPEVISSSTVYGLSKVMNSSIVAMYGPKVLRDTEFTGLRIHNAIGPFCRADLVPVKWTHMLLNKTESYPNLFYREGSIVDAEDSKASAFLHRDFTAVSDICEKVEILLENISLHQVTEYFLGHGDPVSVLNMYRIMSEILGVRPRTVQLSEASPYENEVTCSGNEFEISGEAKFAIEYSKLVQWMKSTNLIPV